MSVGERAPWRCRHGWHAWRFVEMDNLRDVSTFDGHHVWVCRLVEQCARCGIRYTRESAPPPEKAVRVETIRRTA